MSFSPIFFIVKIHTDGFNIIDFKRSIYAIIIAIYTICLLACNFVISPSEKNMYATNSLGLCPVGKMIRVNEGLLSRPMGKQSVN